MVCWDAGVDLSVTTRMCYQNLRKSDHLESDFIFAIGNALVTCPPTPTSGPHAPRMFIEGAPTHCEASSLTLFKKLRNACQIRLIEDGSIKDNSINGRGTKTCERPDCPPDFEVYVNGKNELQVYVWPFLGNSLNNAPMLEVGATNRFYRHHRIDTWQPDTFSGDSGGIRL